MESDQAISIFKYTDGIYQLSRRIDRLDNIRDRATLVDDRYFVTSRFLFSEKDFPPATKEETEKSELYIQPLYLEDAIEFINHPY